MKPKPLIGEWKVIDVIERLLRAGPDADLFVHFTVGGKNYDLNLSDVRVECAGGELPAHVMFEGAEVKLDTPIPKGNVNNDGLLPPPGK